MRWWYEETDYLSSQPKRQLRTARAMNARIIEQHQALTKWRSYAKRLRKALSEEIANPGATLAQKFYCSINESQRGRCLVQCESCRNPPDWATYRDGTLVKDA